MQFLPIKTRKLIPPKDNLFKVLNVCLPKLKEGDVLFIASKVLAIHQGRCVNKSEIRISKSELVKQEADYSLPGRMVKGSEIILTIKDHTLIPSAGIDESNGNGWLILWPENSNKAAKEICQYLKKKNQLQKLAVVITDSHTTPLRWGTQGISIGFWGLNPLYDYRGKKDIFGRQLKYTQLNIVDSLSSMAVLLMGEGAEKTPLIILRGAKFIKFSSKNFYKSFVIDPKKDLYAPILKPFLKARP